MINNNFEWNDFCLLAKSLMKENDIAKQRTSISRFYYGCFCSSRDFILKNRLFLSKKNKKIMKSKSGIVHEETRKVFENHPSIQQKSGKKISKNLEKLRKNRNQADYDINIEFLNKKLSESERRSEIIIKLLNEEFNDTA